MSGRGVVLVAMLALAGCGTPFASCDTEPDLSGRWLLSLTPVLDGNLPRGDTILAELKQVPRPKGIGSLVWGTLSSSDKGFFDTLTIPLLTNNNGSKTGGVLGCTVKINVPVASVFMVTDDDANNGPLRLSLSGTISARGMMTGDVSTVIRVDDPTMMQGSFTWTGVQQQ
jgi:hypothetical protein